VLVRVLKEEPVAPRRIDRRIPRDLETICLTALAKEPSKRYSTVHAMVEDVRRFEAGRPILARRPSLIDRGLRFTRRNWRMSAAIIATALAVALIVLQFFGPSRDQLIAAGDERYIGGRFTEAAQLYRNALKKSNSWDSVIVLERLVLSCHAAADADGELAAALEMLKHDPDAWFGALDYRVAQSVMEKRLGVTAEPYSVYRDYPPEEMAVKRWQIFLNQPFGTEAERSGAEQVLSDLLAKVGTIPAGCAGVPVPPFSLPSDPPVELLRQSNDEKLGAMTRAGAAAAAGIALEKAGDRAGALAAYRKAYDLFRPRFPVYSGLTRGLEMSHPRSHRSEPVECSYLRHVVLALRRLDAEFKNPVRGGLRFRIVGLDLTPDITVHFYLSIWDPAIEGTTTNGGVTIGLDQSAWIGVADGKYRLRIDGKGGGGWSSSEFGARASQLSKHMQLDYTSLPAEIEIVNGETKELTIRAYLSE
jgi:tetratricopeptide (TPR) repeat protein